MSKESHEYSTHLLRQLRQTIGKNIHHHRTRRHMPLAKLAKHTGIPEALLDYYELGKSEIRVDELLRIACCLQVEVPSLFKENLCKRECVNHRYAM